MALVGGSMEVLPEVFEHLHQSSPQTRGPAGAGGLLSAAGKVGRRRSGRMGRHTAIMRLRAVPLQLPWAPVGVTLRPSHVPLGPVSLSLWWVSSHCSIHCTLHSVFGDSDHMGVKTRFPNWYRLWSRTYHAFSATSIDSCSAARWAIDSLILTLLLVRGGGQSPPLVDFLLFIENH